MKRPRWRVLRFLLLSLLLLTSLFTVNGPVRGDESSDSKYFSETGFRVSGRFLDYFTSRGGLEIFGYPISRPFISESGILVQYFQKARMEWHPGNPESYRVQLGLLGEELGYRRAQVPDMRRSFSLRRLYFDETGYSVAYMFLDYFKAHGGIDVFGYPITNMYVEDKQVVQYFQRLKLIWSAGAQGTKMQVGDLGELYVEKYRDRFPPHALTPYTTSLTSFDDASVVRDIQVIVELDATVIGADQEQVVSVLILDESTDDPIANAWVEVTLLDRNRGETLVRVERPFETGEDGRVRIPLPLGEIQPGTYVIARAQITYQELMESEDALFMVWY